MARKYEVITLCGSTRFKEEFMEVQKQLTLAGHIVLSVGLFSHAEENSEEWAENGVKEMLDDIHKRKIDMSDSIFVINKDGYIGESTRSEIEYAKSKGMFIYFLEPVENKEYSLKTKEKLEENEHINVIELPMEGEEYEKIHRHSIAIIRNTFEEKADKYLVYFDERWQCQLFPNWKSKENQKEDLKNIKKQIAADLFMYEEDIDGNFGFEKIHEKYSVSADKNKWYHHSFYDIQISEFPRWVKKRDFVIKRKCFSWMSIAEMETDPRIMKVNADIVNMIKKRECLTTGMSHFNFVKKKCSHKYPSITHNNIGGKIF